MISQRCRHQGRGSVFKRVFTSSIERCAAARVTLAISSFFCFETTPLLFYHGMRIGISAQCTQAFRREFSHFLHPPVLRGDARLATEALQSSNCCILMRVDPSQDGVKTFSRS